MIMFWKFISNFIALAVELPPRYHSLRVGLLIVILIHFVTDLHSVR